MSDAINSVEIIILFINGVLISHIGKLNIFYGTIVYSETPLTNPNRGTFKTNTFFFVVP